MRGKLAVEVLCGARDGRCRNMVGRQWWTPEPEMLQLNTDEKAPISCLGICCAGRC